MDAGQHWLACVVTCPYRELPATAGNGYPLGPVGLTEVIVGRITNLPRQSIPDVNRSLEYADKDGEYLPVTVVREGIAIAPANTQGIE